MAHTAKTKKILALFDSDSELLPASNPLIKTPEEEAIPKIFVKTENGMQIINVSYLLINEQAGIIMHRFRCCTCDKCAAAAMELSAAELPPVLVTVYKKEDEKDVNAAAAELRNTAVRAITKAVISVKSNPRH